MIELDPNDDRSTKRYKLRLSLFNRNIMGFWASRTSNGFSLGPFIPKGEEPYYLTFFRKGDIVNAHLTIGRKPNVNYVDILKFTADEFDRKLESIFASLKNTITVTNIKPETEIFYVGHQLLGLLTSLPEIATTRYKGREKLEDIRLENLVYRAPNLVCEIRNNRKAFFGLAKAKDIIRKSYIAGGFTKEGQFIFVDQGQTLQLKTQPITEWSPGLFNVLKNVFPPIYDVVGMFGIPQLFDEIERRKTFNL